MDVFVFSRCSLALELLVAGSVEVVLGSTLVLLVAGPAADGDAGVGGGGHGKRWAGGGWPRFVDLRWLGVAGWLGGWVGVGVGVGGGGGVGVGVGWGWGWGGGGGG